MLEDGNTIVHIGAMGKISNATMFSDVGFQRFNIEPVIVDDGAIVFNHPDDLAIIFFLQKQKRLPNVQ